MNRELAHRLLENILPNPPWDEKQVQTLLRDLDVLAEHKYNFYEVYQPGRLFFENLYLWLSSFKEEERTAAIDFLRKDLIFVSREEFQQLAQVLYRDKIHQRHLDLAAERAGLPRHRVAALADCPATQRIKRASLYVALSDGARIDYFRRQNLSISNEQVLPTYQLNSNKAENLVAELAKVAGDGSRFECIFLIDDFCGSGRTLLREYVRARVGESLPPLTIPPQLRAYVSYDEENRELTLTYSGSVTSHLENELLSLCASRLYTDAMRELVSRHRAGQTELTGSLVRIAEGLLPGLLAPGGRVFLCPLLITQYALDRLRPLIPRLPSQLKELEILPGAVLPDAARILPPSDSGSSEMGIATLCENHYSDDYGDEHTGSIKYGYDNCGLPIVLHHNTPNNSIYLLWSRKMGKPLFMRFERHGREAA